MANKTVTQSPLMKKLESDLRAVASQIRELDERMMMLAVQRDYIIGLIEMLRDETKPTKN
jgi:hypothetical protein